MWAPSKPQKKKVSEKLYSARCLTMFNSNCLKKKNETNKRETSQVCRYMWYMSHMLFQFILSCEIIFHYLVGDHLWILYMTASPQVRRVGGCALLISLCLHPCMAIKERGATAFNQNIILGLPRKSKWISTLVFTWCSGFFTGISLILWLLLGTCIAL